MATAFILLLVTLLAHSDGIQPAPAGYDQEFDLLIRAYAGVWDNDLLQYDSGTAHWVTNAGTYRGVWFDTEDFFGYPFNWKIESSEFWFYHHVYYRWDTSQFYAELWNGESAPDEFVDRQTVTALHYAPCFADYYPHIILEGNCWLIVNTEMSENGCPSTLSDEQGNFTGEPHSFYSYDFILWEPWTTASVDLSPASWGCIKGLFR